MGARDRGGPTSGGGFDPKPPRHQQGREDWPESAEIDEDDLRDYWGRPKPTLLCPACGKRGVPRVVWITKTGENEKAWRLKTFCKSCKSYIQLVKKTDDWTALAEPPSVQGFLFHPDPPKEKRENYVDPS